MVNTPIEENLYYSVLIEFMGRKYKKTDQKAVMCDMTKEFIVSNIVKRYLAYKDFFVDGYQINRSMVDRFKVYTTNESVAKLVEKESKNSHMGLLLEPIDILEDYKQYTTDITNEILNEFGDFLNNQNVNSKEQAFCNKKVFIVHGHDNEIKQEVARFIENFELNAIILSEQLNKEKTIIEKIEEYSDVGFAIVLYTGCDKGYEKDKPHSIKLRPRQNVVFEHGFFIGKLGRERVFTLVKGEIEIPNDISGIVYTKFDKNGAWKIRLASELKASGYDIDMNKIQN